MLESMFMNPSYFQFAGNRAEVRRSALESANTVMRYAIMTRLRQQLHSSLLIQPLVYPSATRWPRVAEFLHRRLAVSR